MKVLIVKTSSMGDVIHTLPALTDASQVIPDIQFDWVVEESFSEIPTWHTHVDKIIPIAIRRWRKNIFSKTYRKQFMQFRNILREKKYDLVIDAQGLLKSALISRMARGVRCGLDKHSSRGSAIAFLYQKKYFVSQQQHAIMRNRQLFAKILNYEIPHPIPNYGIKPNIFLNHSPQEKPYLVFLHGTTWETKHWPEKNWLALAELANEAGFIVKLPWGNSVEWERANRIASRIHSAVVLPKLNIQGIAKELANAAAIVAVDTGLGHLAAALNIPTISVYGPTNAMLTGAIGATQTHLSANIVCAPCLQRQCRHSAYSQNNLPPCLESISAKTVWNKLRTLISFDNLLFSDLSESRY